MSVLCVGFIRFISSTWVKIILSPWLQNFWKQLQSVQDRYTLNFYKITHTHTHTHAHTHTHTYKRKCIRVNRKHKSFSRSSRPKFFNKKRFLNIFVELTVKCLYQRKLGIVGYRPVTLLKKSLQYRCFPVIPVNLVFNEHLRVNGSTWPVAVSDFFVSFPKCSVSGITWMRLSSTHFGGFL